jgi:hypothetical protein
MKRKLMGAGILFLVLVFVMVSCASSDPVEDVVTPTPSPVSSTPETPAVQTPSVPATPSPETPVSVSQAVIDALNAARALADTNRTLSLEVESPEYFPSEWNAIESQYVQTNGTALGNESAYQTATDSYNRIAADFENIALDALPLYAEDFYNRGLAERAAAVEAGILDIDPERFLVADDYALAALAAWETQDYVTAVISARNALPRYTALKIGAEAYKSRMNIEGQRFASYDRTAINAVDEIALLAVSQYDQGDIAGLDNAETALYGYNMINQALATGAEAYDSRIKIEGQRFASYDRAPIDVVDGVAYTALDQYHNVDAAAVPSAELALSGYNLINEALEVGAEAYDARVKVEGQRFASYDRAPIDMVDGIALQALDQYHNADPSAIASAEDALYGYNAINEALTVGAEAYDARMAIEDQRFASYDRTAIDAADAIAFTALDQYSAADIAALANARKALSEYTMINEALDTGTEAYDARMEIAYWIDLATDTAVYNANMGLEYGDYDAYETTLNAADQDAYLALDQYDRGDVAAALASAKKALLGYDTTISQAYTDAATIIGDAAVNAQKKAVDNKAPVAAKQEYAEAEAVYARGKTFLTAENYQGAAESYYQSVEMFHSVAELSEYKRQQALAAIAEAERRIAESDQSAEDAEVRLGGGSL